MAAEAAEAAEAAAAAVREHQQLPVVICGILFGFCSGSVYVPIEQILCQFVLAS